MAGLVLVSLLFLGGYLGLLWVFEPREVVADFGGSYTEGLAGSPIALNPLLSQFNDVDKDLVSLIFSGLTKLDKKGMVIPDLADRWEISEDGLSYTFFLRSNVKWHDGTPFSADDVVFTVKAIQDAQFQGFPELATLWRNFTVEKITDRVVRFRLKEPFAPFLSYSNIGILPAHILKDVPAEKLPEHPLNVNPIGTGPFKMSEANAEQVTLMANQDYFLGRPYLNQIQFRFYHDEQAALAAFEAKQTQGVLLRPVAAGMARSKLERNAQVELYTEPRSSYVVLFFNDRSPLFQDPKVRQALFLALDRQRIIKGAVAGQGMVASGPILPKTWAYNEALPPPEFKPHQAKSLLDEAGWQIGPENIREKDGVRFSFDLLTDDDPTRVKIIQEIARQLGEIGIDVKTSASGYTGLIQNFLIPRKFVALLYGMDVGYDPDAYAAWHSSQIKEDGFNFASFSDKQVDETLEKARTTADRATRAQLYQQFQTLFAEKVPSILLYYPLYTYAVDKKVQGIDMGVMFEPSSRFFSVRQWYLNTKPKP